MKILFAICILACILVAIVGVVMVIDSILRPKNQKKDMSGLLQWMTYFELTKQTDIMKMRRVKRYRW